MQDSEVTWVYKQVLIYPKIKHTFRMELCVMTHHTYEKGGRYE
ncbi:hypothetical protein THOB06_60094 [Vibrio rotiferianus]|nr:hypothetical protein THOG10_60094 [Vibrio rotiferianus]CAH1593322.1 hypothetical protein THOB06_60094 [Vibrio rotiferianus]